MRSTFLSLNVHIVFSTKNREPFLHDDIRDMAHDYMGGTIRGLGGIPVRIGGVEDHVHLLFKYNATNSIAKLVQEIKKSSNSWMKEIIPYFAWQEGYGAFSVSQERMKGVEKYIRSQVEHHKTMSFRDERIMLYRLAGIDFDPDDLD